MTAGAWKVVPRTVRRARAPRPPPGQSHKPQQDHEARTPHAGRHNLHTFRHVHAGVRKKARAIEQIKSRNSLSRTLRSAPTGLQRLNGLAALLAQAVPSGFTHGLPGEPSRRRAARFLHLPAPGDRMDALRSFMG
ncbi:hypothetical protein GCM10010433_16490 [Streptomyces pulveraceus]